MTDEYKNFPKSKKELKELRKNGSKVNRYFTGKPCKKCGIVGLRQPSGNCVNCAEEYNKEYGKKYRETNCNKIKQHNKEYYQINKQYKRERMKQYYEANKEYHKQYYKEYREINSNQIKAYKREYYKQRYQNDPEYRTSKTMRKFVHRTFNAMNTPKHDTTNNLLNYSPRDLMNHLENHFLEGMSWENYGEWHIDHSVSVMEHIRNGETDPAVINALNNLYPVWAEHNISKSDKDFEQWLSENPEMLELYGHFLEEDA